MTIIVHEQQATLTSSEHESLHIYEATIARGLQTFYEVGEALLAIRDNRLYRAEYATFDDYCQQRWGMKKAHAYRLIQSAEVVASLESPIGDMPSNEAQARPLAKLPADERAAAWQEARERSNGKPTAKDVQQVVQERTSQASGSYPQPAILPPGWYWQQSSNPADIVAINRNRHDQISGFLGSYEACAARAWELHHANQTSEQPAPEAAPEAAPPPEKDAFENGMRGAIASAGNKPDYQRIGRPDESERVSREHMIDLQARGYFFSHYERSKQGGIYAVFWHTERQYRILAASVPYYLERKEGKPSLFVYANMRLVDADEPERDSGVQLQPPESEPELPPQVPVCDQTIIACIQDAYRMLQTGDHAGACQQAHRFRAYPHVVGYISAAITGMYRAMKQGEAP